MEKRKYPKSRFSRDSQNTPSVCWFYKMINLFKISLYLIHRLCSSPIRCPLWLLPALILKYSMDLELSGVILIGTGDNSSYRSIPPHLIENKSSSTRIWLYFENINKKKYSSYWINSQVLLVVWKNTDRSGLLLFEIVRSKEAKLS